MGSCSYNSAGLRLVLILLEVRDCHFKNLDTITKEPQSSVTEVTQLTAGLASFMIVVLKQPLEFSVADVTDFTF